MLSPNHPPPQSHSQPHPYPQPGLGAPAPESTSAPGGPAAPPLPPPPPQASPSPQPEFTVRPTLPDRNVTADSIEDAYVRFIFYCNPALPLSSETTSLREAFRNPPRSGGKSFNTFTVFELVCKFYDKEIRTWTELTTKLGVEPPDPSKDESAQKIAQYGVRLKKWMNSMHVKAFFEYLMNIPNDYWTKIPTDPSPVSQPIRDGVAIEDDMALRALLPHIRPKRGRKRPTDEDGINSPAHRNRLSPSAAIEESKNGSQLQVPPDPRAPPTPWTPSDAVQQMPLTRWPQSAITPTSRNSFWDDALEPRSAVTPSKPRLTAQRRGPKNVSSAWRPGVPDGGVKMRGRPPINRTPVDTVLPPFPSGTPTVGPGEAPTPVFPTPIEREVHPLPGLIQAPSPVLSSPARSTPNDGTRPPRPSISLQVPERPTGSVRLATPPPPPPPPPVVVINGDNSNPPIASFSRQEQENGRIDFAQVAKEVATPGQDKPPQQKDIPAFHFERVEDRTNIDKVLGSLTQATLDADWRDVNGKPGDPPSMDEVMALVNATIEDMYKTASSPQAFLVPLAAISGGGMLQTSAPRITRLPIQGRLATYRCDWEYGFGSVRGLYTMEQRVPLSMFRESSPEHTQEGQDVAGGEQEKLSTGEWQEKYRHLLEDVQKKDQELLDLRSRVMKSLGSEFSKK